MLSSCTELVAAGLGLGDEHMFGKRSPLSTWPSPSLTAEASKACPPIVPPSSLQQSFTWWGQVSPKPSRDSESCWLRTPTNQVSSSKLSKHLNLTTSRHHLYFRDPGYHKKHAEYPQAGYPLRGWDPGTSIHWLCLPWSKVVLRAFIHSPALLSSALVRVQGKPWEGMSRVCLGGGGGTVMEGVGSVCHTFSKCFRGFWSYLE